MHVNGQLVFSKSPARVGEDCKRKGAKSDVYKIRSKRGKIRSLQGKKKQSACPSATKNRRLGKMGKEGGGGRSRGKRYVRTKAGEHEEKDGYTCVFSRRRRRENVQRLVVPGGVEGTTKRKGNGGGGARGVHSQNGSLK